MKKVVSLILICILSSGSLCGCFSYRDINKLIFATAVIVDVDKDKRPIIYIEALKAFRSTTSASEQGERLILKGTGKSVYEAMRDIHLSTSYKLNYTQNKVIIFTTKASHYGIDNWIDIFDRDQEFVVRPYLAITDETPEDLLNLKSIKDDYLGIFIKRLIDNEGASTRSVRLAINEYLSRRLIGSQTCVVTAISIKKNVPEERVEIVGGSVFQDDKLVALLSRAEGQGYNFLMNTLKTGSLEISNPEHDGSFVSLNILGSRTKTELTYDGKVIKLKKTIQLKTNIEEIDKDLEEKDHRNDSFFFI